jgi:hypothetical protein
MKAPAFSLTIVALGLLGCGATVEEPAATEETQDTVAVTVSRPTMPEVPPAPVGHLALMTASRSDQYLVDGQWKAYVDRCESAGIAQVLAQTEGYGIAVLLPWDSSGPLSLPVMAVNDTTLPEESVRVVVQIYPEDRAYVLKAIDGTADLEISAGSITGRFTVTLVESTYRDTVLGAGSFESLPVRMVGDEYCQPLLARPDTTDAGGVEPAGRLQ